MLEDSSGFVLLTDTHEPRGALSKPHDGDASEEHEKGLRAHGMRSDGRDGMLHRGEAYQNTTGLQQIPPACILHLDIAVLDTEAGAPRENDEGETG